MIANLLDKNLVRLLSYFLISPGSRWKRKEIKEKTLMNNVPLDSTLQHLLALKVLREKKNLFELNLENEEMYTILTPLKKEYVSFNVPYAIFNLLVELSEKLSKKNGIKSAILFGSYAKLIHSNTSDIDIAVIFSKELKNSHLLEKRVKKRSEKIEKKYKKKIELHFFREEDLKKKDPLIQEIQRNGKVLF